MDTSKQPYYSAAAKDLFIPVALVYTCLVHCWVFFRRANIQNSLPPPEDGNRKIAIVTGSNTGIGLETAQTLAVEYGWEVILACRSKDKALRAMESINNQANNGKAVVIDQPLDLGDFDSVRKFAREIRERYPTINVLVNNAGLNTTGRSQNNLDLLFQANFLGHFLLTNLLIDNLKDGKVINLSSLMHHFAGTKTLDLEFWKYVSSYSATDPPPESYWASKLAMIFFSQELNRRFGKSHNIQSISVNPGSVASDIWRGYPGWIRNVFQYVYLSPQQGCVPSVAAAVSKSVPGTLLYLQPYWNPNPQGRPMIPFTEMLGPYVGFTTAAPRLPAGGGSNEAKALWEASEDLTK